MKKANLGGINKDILLGLIEIQKRIIMLRPKTKELTELIAGLQNPLSNIIQGMTDYIPKFPTIDSSFKM